jgi:glycosyltransferase involved in cell wall biosynthesis
MNIRKPQHCSLVITTYNWKQALSLVLDSVARQRVLPDEVIVADDGSRADTGDAIRQRAADFPTRLRHVWQEDLGFRAARVRNLAIAAARFDYVLLIDGDMVLDKHFFADHLETARPGCFVQGSRVLTGPTQSKSMLEHGRLDLPFFARDIERRRHTLRLPAISRLLRRPSSSPRGIKTCNQGWWREDLIRLNGFDERMHGWGREDDELAARAFNAGMRRIALRCAGLAIHLHHTERHIEGESFNDRYLQETRAAKLTRCKFGLDSHLQDAVDAGQIAA